MMQGEGKPKFLKFHQGSVRGVAFSPRDRYLFCSGGYDGKVNLYSAMRAELLMSYTITTMTLARNINAVKFTMDGSKILAATTSRRLAVVDVERGEQLLAYDNCAYSGRERSAIAANPICPNIVVCVTVNGRGLSLFDLRMPLPLDSMYDLHTSTIKEVTFVHPSWPWTFGVQSPLLTASMEGTCKVNAFDGRSLHSFYAGQTRINTVCVTPEIYTACYPSPSHDENPFYSLIMCGGDQMTAYVPEVGIKETIATENKTSPVPIWKLRYTSNGSLLYTVSDDGWVRRYRRYPDHHQYLGQVYSHKGDIQDMDISPYDEYVVTASKDKTVGLLSLGSPSHGWTEYSEFT